MTVCTFHTAGSSTFYTCSGRARQANTDLGTRSNTFDVSQNIRLTKSYRIAPPLRPAVGAISSKDLCSYRKLWKRTMSGRPCAFEHAMQESSLTWLPTACSQSSEAFVSRLVNWCRKGASRLRSCLSLTPLAFLCSAPVARHLEQSAELRLRNSVGHSCFKNECASLKKEAREQNTTERQQGISAPSR
jgi:hypothetical protein